MVLPMNPLAACIALTLALAGTGFAAEQLMSEVPAEAAQATATTSIQAVVGAARSSALLTGQDFVVALDDTAAAADSQGALTSSGSTLTWQAQGYCYQADVPTSDAPIFIVSC